MATRKLRCFPPLINKRSRVLVLGSMPSPQSLKRRQYYGNPQNHFWQIMADVLQRPLPSSYEKRRRMILERGIALWDVIASCEREGAADSRIRRVIPNDLSRLLRSHPEIRVIFLNGHTAEKLFRTHFRDLLHLPAFYLPSTSPAHAVLSFERKRGKWNVLHRYIKN